MDKSGGGVCKGEAEDSWSTEEADEGWCNGASQGLMELLGAERQRLRAELQVLRATPWPRPGATAVLRRQWCGGVTGGAWPRNELSAASRHRENTLSGTDTHSGGDGGGGKQNRDLSKKSWLSCAWPWPSSESVSATSRRRRRRCSPKNIWLESWSAGGSCGMATLQAAVLVCFWATFLTSCPAAPLSERNSSSRTTL